MRQLAIVLVVLLLLAVPTGDLAHSQTDSDRTPITGENATVLEPLIRLPNELQAVEDVTFSADGSLLAAGGYFNCPADADRHTCPGRVVLWTSGSGDVVTTFEAFAAPVISVAFSPDGTRFAALDESGQIQVWALPSRDEIAAFDNAQGIGDITFNLDGTLLASTGGEGAVRVWSMADNTESRPILAGYSTKFSLAFSPVEPLVALGGFREVGLWQVREPSENGGIVNVSSANLRAGPGTGYGVLGIALGGEELIILGTNDLGDWYNIETAAGLNAWIAGYLLDTDDVAGRAPREIATVTLPDDGETIAADLAFSRDGTRFASANFDLITGQGSLTVWQKDLTLLPVPEDAPPTPTPTPTPADAVPVLPALIGNLSMPEPLVMVSFNADGNLLAYAGEDDVLRLWIVGAGAELAAYETPLRTLDFSPDGTWLAAGLGDGTVELWGAPAG
ncbi:MAG TPA: SH3 domain-containing protein [Aggregatilinea sp.]|uniref:WD40 repeat domain-containing protein n=1 Tax=Aggregatilinea sp. TaxID=2806333 RepID=UPI002C0BA289|nr:SH3 domain-containing protein [Aggregatilinea sp.]HML23831.1 SH3 domain-containing protein [Aggregatilinea sp.]